MIGGKIGNVKGAKSKPDFMQPEINQTCLSLSTAKETWDAVNQTYSKIGIMTQVYKLKCQIHATKKGSWPMTEYYNKLQSAKLMAGIRSLPAHRNCFTKQGAL